MFDPSVLVAPAALPGQVEAARWIESLAGHDGRDLTDAERIDAIQDLERLKSAAAAAQARITESFDRSQRAAAPPLKSPGEVSRSIAGQVALARRESPTRGQQHLGVALGLVRDLPETLAALTSGRISEWRATLIVRETATLTREDRLLVDAEIAPHLAGSGDRRIADLARKIGYRLDPGAATRRLQKAEGDRRVSIRPAPDTMSNLTALLPVTQGVAVYASLRKHAESLRAQGDIRTLHQLMADTLVQRLTGQASPSSVEIQLVISERTLLRGGQEPAHLPGYGSVPASLARRLVRDADKTWIRRLYTAPGTNELVAMDSTRRTFRGKLRQLVVLRDQWCRTPWCDAPVAHLDHVRRARDGGATTAANSQGLCEACNYTKESTGWRADVVRASGHCVELTTATGHRYRSDTPPQPGDPPRMTLEQRLRDLTDYAA